MATRFQVPQFIEHSPKVVGPLTLQQSLFLLIPAAVAFALFFFLPIIPWAIIAILIIGMGAVSAFLKVEGKTLPSIVLSFFRFTITSKNYLWQKGKIRVRPGQQMEYGTPPETPQEKGQLENDVSTPIQISHKSKLQDLSLKIETGK